MDGYLVEETKNDVVKFQIFIEFDKETLLPVMYRKEFIQKGIPNHTRISNFKNYTCITDQKISAIDSIPNDFVPFKYKYKGKEKDKQYLNKTAINFKLKQINGDSLELNSISNQIILLEFSSLNCGACRMAIPYLINLRNSTNQNYLTILNIDMVKKSNIKLLNKEIKEKNINYPYLIDGIQVAVAYNIQAMPTFLLLNKEKKIIDISVGFSAEEFLLMKKEIIEICNKLKKE